MVGVSPDRRFASGCSGWKVTIPASTPRAVLTIFACAWEIVQNDVSFKRLSRLPTAGALD